jgi:hypothetical protein
MDKNKLFSITNYVEISLWVLVIILGYLAMTTQKNILFYITAYIFILLGISMIGTHIYFKKSYVLSGVSPTSKIAIAGTVGLSLLVFYFAYYILTHFV